ILLVAAHLLVAAAAHGGQRRTAIPIAFGRGAGNGQTAARGAIVGAARRPLGLGSAGAAGIFQFRLSGGAMLGRAGPRAASIGLAGRGRWHIANGGHAGAPFAGWTAGGTGRAAITGRTGARRAAAIGAAGGPFGTLRAGG